MDTSIKNFNIGLNNSTPDNKWKVLLIVFLQLFTQWIFFWFAYPIFKLFNNRTGEVNKKYSYKRIVDINMMMQE